MTNKEIKKYFEKRPSVDTLYVVGGIVFIDEFAAANYSDMMGGKVETHRRGDEETETVELTDASTGSAAETVEKPTPSPSEEGNTPENAEGAEKSTESPKPKKKAKK